MPMPPSTPDAKAAAQQSAAAAASAGAAVPVSPAATASEVVVFAAPPVESPPWAGQGAGDGDGQLPGAPPPRAGPPPGVSELSLQSRAGAAEPELFYTGQSVVSAMPTKMPPPQVSSPIPTKAAPKLLSVSACGVTDIRLRGQQVQRLRPPPGHDPQLVSIFMLPTKSAPTPKAHTEPVLSLGQRLALASPSPPPMKAPPPVPEGSAAPPPPVPMVGQGFKAPPASVLADMAASAGSVPEVVLANLAKAASAGSAKAPGSALQPEVSVAAKPMPRVWLGPSPPATAEQLGQPGPMAKPPPPPTGTMPPVSVAPAPAVSKRPAPGFHTPPQPTQCGSSTDQPVSKGGGWPKPWSEPTPPGGRPHRGSYAFGYGSGGGTEQWGQQWHPSERLRQGVGVAQWVSETGPDAVSGYKILLGDIPQTEDWSLQAVSFVPLPL